MMKQRLLLEWILLVALIFVASKVSFSQDDESKGYPVIGQPCPEFMLTDIHGKPGEQISLSDLRGEYVILDFWNAGCVSCIASFPKINEWQKMYQDKLKIVLIGQDYKGYQNIKTSFEKYREKHDLIFTSAYDNELFNNFKIRGVPLHIWIDPEGIVKAVTNFYGMNEENINRFVEGEDFDFIDVSYDKVNNTESTYNPDLPFLINGNGGTADDDFLFRSVLSKWKPGMRDYTPSYIDGKLWESREQTHPKFETLKEYLPLLYKLAYWGERSKGANNRNDDTWFFPIIETKDSLLFNYDEFYSYSVIVPQEKASKENLMRIMQNDLNSYFGYKVVFEEREMPCWYITADRKARNRLKSKGGETKMEWSNTGYCVQNASLQQIIQQIVNRKPSGFLLYDDTGIQEGATIDFCFEALMMDWDDVIEKFDQIGLKITPGTKKLNVMVIKDPDETI